ncbi:ubiquitin-related domain-containing protein [Phanerochaete sordida]|uniref:Ubiquitin-related domain-containing protein n=1 Tax=Phanerochaete sordida TaxID=48140 RepID=A0A9P3GR02_9APHY|nr:ubiquitin-related domain-containing protein [Phanerochaete sordida]
MAGGAQPYTTTLASDAKLRQIAEHLAEQGLNVDSATQFPRKQFSQEDFGRTLCELGLTPSAVLIAS